MGLARASYRVDLILEPEPPTGGPAEPVLAGRLRHGARAP